MWLVGRRHTGTIIQSQLVWLVKKILLPIERKNASLFITIPALSSHILCRYAGEFAKYDTM